MGCDCSKDEGYNPGAGDKIEDNPSNYKDPQQRLEKSFPFYRVHIMAFYEKVMSIGKDKFTIMELSGALNTEAWAGKFGPGTDLNKLLNSLPNCGNDDLDKCNLLCLGLLWCDGGAKDKTEVLLGMCNPPG